MANKVLIGVGIGCGSLLLLAVGAVVVGGMWVKSKVGDVVEVGKAAEEQQQQAVKLDEKYPFEPPVDDKPVKLTDAQLKKYLAIRAAIVPIYKGFEAKAKELDQRNKGKKAGLAEGLEAVGMFTGLYKEVREKWLEELDRHQMSPKEFGTVTGTVYASQIGKGMAEMERSTRPAMEQGIAELEKMKQRPDLSAEAKAELDEQLASMKQQLAELSAEGEVSEDAKVWEANVQLLERYKVEIERDALPALDWFLLGQEGADGMEKAFDPLKRLRPKGK
ncbi:MAG: hypothetical protein ACOZIN_16155 [Myxococcota bacterium]